MNLIHKLAIYYKNSFKDVLRFVKYSNALDRFNSQPKYLGMLTMLYHVIEKGLTMPNARLGFGYQNINRIIGLCNEYISKGYDQSANEFRHTVKILNEYVDFHKTKGFELDSEIVSKISKLASDTGIFEKSNQYYFTKEEFFSKVNAPFAEFCLSRHTVRHYIEKEIPLEVLKQCEYLAKHSPSACNRQPNRVYFVKNKSDKERVLSLQNGNRGFGHLADTIVVFTSDLSIFQNVYERYEAYLNSGMFIMTFINAIHHYGFGACALNWNVPTEKDEIMRKIVGVGDSEVITMIMSCGEVAGEFGVAESPKF